MDIWGVPGKLADSVEIGDMTVGFSGKGMSDFSNALKELYVKQVCEELESLEKDILMELSKCWTGESKDKYVKRLSGGIEKIENELRAEWNDLSARLAEIGEFYIKEDKKLAE